MEPKSNKKSETPANDTGKDTGTGNTDTAKSNAPPEQRNDGGPSFALDGDEAIDVGPADRPAMEPDQDPTIGPRGDIRGDNASGAGGETLGESVDHMEAEIDAEIDQISALEAELKEMRDHALRARAEAENVRKRSEKQIADAGKYGAASFARDMLSVSDNMRRALDAVPKEAMAENEALKQLLTGVEMVEKELQTALSKHGVQEVSPQPGEKFEHSLHQAMMEVETADHPPGSVAVVLQAGYVIHDRLLRAAMVGVAKAPAGPVDEDDNVDGG
jgi:molecular chaperone GrpE